MKNKSKSLALIAASIFLLSAVTIGNWIRKL